ncbi:hypothetical protein V8E55_002180 [Tylopilus felleus]
MAGALPSFIELMASLGLDNDAKPTPPHITTPRPRSGSCSSVSSHGSSNPGCSPTSPSFSISEPTTRDVDTDRRHGSVRLRTVRFSPYISPSSSTRQSSSTSLTPSAEESENGRRSVSPRLSSSPGRNKPSPLQSAKNSRELHATTPISSFARRRTPQNSPTTASFPHRVHVDRPETITLPSLLPAPISH